jgi:TRAP-type C4-dicarboxylate transport system permease small subunit
MKTLISAVEYGLLTATFLAAPWVLSRHAHVTIDLLTSALRPAAARRLAQFVAVLGFLFSVTFLWFALQAALISAARGSMIRTAFVVPEWWALMAAPIGFALIAIEFLRQIFRPVSTHDVTGL